MADDGLDAADLREAHDDEQDVLRFLRKAAAAVEERRTAVHVLHDVVADGLGLRRDDEDGLRG